MRVIKGRLRSLPSSAPCTGAYKLHVLILEPASLITFKATRRGGPLELDTELERCFGVLFSEWNAIAGIFGGQGLILFLRTLDSLLRIVSQ